MNGLKQRTVKPHHAIDNKSDAHPSKDESTQNTREEIQGYSRQAISVKVHLWDRYDTDQ